MILHCHCCHDTCHAFDGPQQMAPLTLCIYRSSSNSLTPPSLCPVPTSTSTICDELHHIQIAISSSSSSSNRTVAVVALSQYDCVCSMWIACVVSVLLHQSIIVSGSILFNVNCMCTVVSPSVLLYR